MALESSNLTKNQKTVLDVLENSAEPLKAYTILFDIQKKGIKSPLQVYRALDKLIEIGKVHKIESRNSYIACKHENCNAKNSTAFLICENCEKVTEQKRDNVRYESYRSQVARLPEEVATICHSDLPENVFLV